MEKFHNSALKTALYKGQCSTSPPPLPPVTLSLDENPGTYLIGDLVGPRVGLDVSEKSVPPLPGFESGLSIP